MLPLNTSFQHIAPQNILGWQRHLSGADVARDKTKIGQVSVSLATRGNPVLLLCSAHGQLVEKILIDSEVNSDRLSVLPAK